MSDLPTLFAKKNEADSDSIVHLRSKFECFASILEVITLANGILDPDKKLWHKKIQSVHNNYSWWKI